MKCLPSSGFWRGKRVFLTGNTGFKGSWLSIWLIHMGAKVYGYALNPPTKPSLFEICSLADITRTTIADIRDISRLQKALKAAKPDIVIHMAAQPLVCESYRVPRYTYEVNVIGAVNLFEAVRACGGVKAVINVTTDKCYENRECSDAYREDEPLGGYDPYSSSKACSELVTAAYRNSFFNVKDYKNHGVALASARAGNVIGGGDWAADRLIPDIIRAILSRKKALIRNPKSIRPWQHVLEPLAGYLILAQKLYQHGPSYAQAWNFGPARSDAKNVDWIVKRVFQKWPEAPGYVLDRSRHPHEARYLKLDSSKARRKLLWRPRWDTGRAIDRILDWTQAFTRKENMRRVCVRQIEEYLED